LRICSLCAVPFAVRKNRRKTSPQSAAQPGGLPLRKTREAGQCASRHDYERLVVRPFEQEIGREPQASCQATRECMHHGIARSSHDLDVNHRRLRRETNALRGDPLAPTDTDKKSLCKNCNTCAKIALAHRVRPELTRPKDVASLAVPCGGLIADHRSKNVWKGIGQMSKLLSIAARVRQADWPAGDARRVDAPGRARRRAKQDPCGIRLA
jgi:hypothetical protein